ncbi:hypothetical protein BD779DRAFT_1549586 [Infundibulicybe gibba]|nr:hypothetical protein BD779DRAFT_1549586 [Infundibulicybe gibba]
MLLSTSKLALAFIPLFLVCKAAVALPQSAGDPKPEIKITKICTSKADCNDESFPECCPAILGGMSLCLKECPKPSTR